MEQLQMEQLQIRQEHAKERKTECDEKSCRVGQICLGAAAFLTINDRKDLKQVFF